MRKQSLFERSCLSNVIDRMWLQVFTSLSLFLKSKTVLNNQIFKNKSCTCPALFTGSRCDIRISYCSSSPCLNGGTCLDTQFGFLCTCPIGYQGILCTNLINVSFNFKKSILKKPHKINNLKFKNERIVPRIHVLTEALAWMDWILTHVSVQAHILGQLVKFT